MATAGVFELSKNDQIEQQFPNLYDDLLAQTHDTVVTQKIAKLRSATGDKLPLPEEELITKIRYEETSVCLGALASEAIFSTITGCWSVIKKRNSEGYVPLYRRTRYGLERPTNGRNYGITAHRLAYILKLREEGLPDKIPKGIDIDHICRNTACCNPQHVRGVSYIENNILKNKAHRIEPALALGQLMLGNIGISWFDKSLLKAEQEDTGMVVSTRFGPHRIFKLSDEPLISYAKREPCEVFDALLPPAISRRKFKSRAKQTTVHDNQGMLFVSNLIDELPNDNINTKGRVT